MATQQDTEQFLIWLKTQIPLLNHMGLGALAYDGKVLTIPAALEPNINDKGTGFGGSLATLATISGWCLTTLLLRDHDYDCDVMIRDCNMSYLAPVKAAFASQVVVPEQPSIDQFLQRLSEKGRARLALTIQIICEGETTLEMQGNYVAIARMPHNKGSI